jgi:hypothetical protein
MSGSPDYKALFLREKRRNQHTTFSEFIRACHTLLSTSLKVETTSRSTRGTIPPPSGKYCPTRRRLWEDCPARQQAIYDAVVVTCSRHSKMHFGYFPWRSWKALVVDLAVDLSAVTKIWKVTSDSPWKTASMA